MQTRNLRLVLVFFTTLTVCGLTHAQSAGRIESMKLLTADTGWAATRNKLFWTTDGGASWGDVTPPHGQTQTLRDVLFLDASRGWALFGAYDEARDSYGFRMARTSNSGRSWVVTTVSVPSQKPGELVGNGFLDFEDDTHGWLLLPAISGSAFSWGLLLTTHDGGKAWSELPQAPIAGRPVFASARDGWIYGNGGGGGVFCTHDGGRTWARDEPTLGALPSSLPTSPSYVGMRFVDEKRGFLLARLQPSTDAQESRGTALVLYVTSDGGQTWQRGQTVTDRHSRIGASALVFDARAAAPVVIAVSTDRSSPSGLALLADAQAGTIAAEEAPSVTAKSVPWRGGDAISELSFITPAQGWAITKSGELLSTGDGGAGWEDISPIKTVRRSNATQMPQPRKYGRSSASGLSTGDSSPSEALVYDQSLGFDRNNVLP